MTTCLTKWRMLREQHIMPRSKEIQEQMRNKRVDMYWSRKGYKAISKAWDSSESRAIIHKIRKLGTVVNLPRSGWPTKTIPRGQWRLIQELIKEPRATSKELQASLASIKVSVHDSTINKETGQTRHSWEFQAKSHCWPKRTQRLISHLPKNILIIPNIFEQIFCDWWNKSWTFWKVCVPLHLA